MSVIPAAERVAVIVPSFNRAHLLPRALDSICAQTRPADQIIVVDDGSDDGTTVLVTERYPQVQLLRQHNTGVSAARNAGVRVALDNPDGVDWIALLDSDDTWQPAKLERQLAASCSDDVLIHCDEIWVRNGRRVNPMRKHGKRGGRIYRDCLPLCAISPSAALIRYQLFEQLGGFDESLPACEDYDFWLRVCARYPVRLVAEPLVVKYGGHDDQLSRRYWGMDRFRITALEKILNEGVLEHDDRRATLTVLLKKIDVYQRGARRRGRVAEADEYAARGRRAMALLGELDAAAVRP